MLNKAAEVTMPASVKNATVYIVVIDIAKKEDDDPINLYLTYNSFGTQSWCNVPKDAHNFPNIMEAIDAVDKGNITMRIGESVKSVVIMGLETKSSIVRSWTSYGHDIKNVKGAEKL